LAILRIFKSVHNRSSDLWHACFPDYLSQG
jgi:hypothetical protein